MTISLATGDLLQADAEALVNTVNTQGVMGKGIALQFKRAFPDMFAEYQRAAEAGLLVVGMVYVYDAGAGARPRYIVNFPTKMHWRDPSKLEWIAPGLQSLVHEVKARQIHSIAVPALGCGLGGLAWKDVLPLIQVAFARTPDVRVLVYPPRDEAR